MSWNGRGVISPRFWIGVVVLWVMLAVLTSATRLVSHSLPNPGLLLTTSDCPQPCWQGIRPGFSTRAEFVARQQENLYRYQTSATYQSYPDDPTEIVRDITLTMRGDVSVGDVLVAFGSPSHVRMNWVAGMPIDGRQGGRQTYVGATFYFADGLVMVEVVRLDCRWRLSPDMLVRRVRYYAPSPAGGVIPIGTPLWRGFVAQAAINGVAC